MLTLYQVIPMQYVDIIPGNTNAICRQPGNMLTLYQVIPMQYVDIIPGNTNAIC